MLFIYRFIFGFLKLRFTGDFTEQIINSATKEGISLWGLRYNKRAITGYVSIKNFKKLRIIRRKTGVKIEILDKRGLPFIINRYKNRFGLLVGTVLFFLVIEFLSSFIWGIEVYGNSIVDTKKILKDCNSIGISEGVKIANINPKNYAQRLLLKSNGLAWASLNIEGCIVNVNVTEIKNQPDKQSELPSNLVSTDEGIIKLIDVTSGNVLVSVGQAVKKGEVLVSGIYEKMSSTVFVPSRGSIDATVYKTLSLNGDFDRVDTINTQQTKTRRSIKIFNFKIPLYIDKLNGEYIKESEINRISIYGKKLPIYIHNDKYNFTYKKNSTLSEEELKVELREKIKKQLESDNYKNFTVIRESVENTPTGIILTQEITAEKNIAEVKNISVKQ